MDWATHAGAKITRAAARTGITDFMKIFPNGDTVHWQCASFTAKRCMAV
jgi:hypothetical protein